MFIICAEFIRNAKCVNGVHTAGQKYLLNMQQTNLSMF